MEKHDFEKDFEQFLKNEADAVPMTSQSEVLNAVHAELNPSPLKVFLKSSGIFSAGGLTSLVFCPQFGISLGSSHGLMSYLMNYGEEVCMLGCGILFMGLGLLAVALFLKPEEVRVFRSYRILQLAFFSLLSISAFYCAGGEVIASSALIWSLGAILGGATSLDLGWRMRKVYILAG